MEFKLVVIGTSLGGLTALELILGQLPADFPLPIAVVQHRSARSTALASLIQRHAPLRVREPNDKERLEPGCVYLAPADYHLMVDGDVLALSTEEPVHYARPSIDVLFETAAESYSRHVIAVILTGASRDGAAGAAAIKRAGGYLVVQDPASAESSVMPAAARASADVVLPLEEIAPLLIKLCGLG